MKKVSLSVKICIGLVLGVIVGIFLQSKPEIATTYIQPFGTLFLNLIKLVIVPLVFSSLLVGVCSLGDIKKLGRLGGKTVLYFFLTTVFAITFGLVLANVMHVGAGYQIATQTEATASEIPSMLDTFLNIIPSNPLKALVEGNMLQTIAFALILGCGVVAIGEKGKIVEQFFDSIAETMYKITAAIMNLAPYGVFALIAPVIAVNGVNVLLPLISVIIAVYLGSILHAVIVYSSTVKFFANVGPIQFFKKVAPAIAIAFTTSSSAGTLPVSMKCVEENLGVSKPVASFVLPLGTTINMDGTALYQGVCALFVANVYGMSLNIQQQITIILTATLASVGTAGVPGAGMVMLTMVLQAVGLPIEGIALVAGIDRILDMARTTVNVVGNCACSVVISASEKDLDRSKL